MPSLIHRSLAELPWSAAAAKWPSDWRSWPRVPWWRGENAIPLVYAMKTMGKMRILPSESDWNGARIISHWWFGCWFHVYREYSIATWSKLTHMFWRGWNRQPVNTPKTMEPQGKRYTTESGVLGWCLCGGRDHCSEVGTFETPYFFSYNPFKVVSPLFHGNDLSLPTIQSLGLKQVLTVRSVPHFVHLWWLSQLSPIMWVCLKIGTPWYPQFQKDSHHFANLNSNSRARPIFEQSETLWKTQRIPTSGFSCRFSYQCCRNPCALHVVDRHVSVARCSSPTPGPSWLRPPG